MIPKWCLRAERQVINRKKKKDKLNIINIENVCTSKDNIKKVKRKLYKGRKYLEVIYLIRDLYTEM